MSYWSRRGFSYCWKEYWG